MPDRREVEFSGFVLSVGLIVFCLLLISSRLASIAQSLKVLASPPSEEVSHKENQKTNQVKKIDR